MFKEKLTIDKIQVIDSVEDWKMATRESVLPLEKDGLVPSVYKEKIIETIDEIGPYIFIAPNIALPHVQLFGETKMGVSLLKLNEPVHYDQERNAHLFFAFSAEDGDSHMAMIQELAIFLSEEKNVTALIEMTDVNEIYEYIQVHG